MNEEQLHELGQRVTTARLRRGLGKEAAAREAGVSSITLKRIEDGLSVRDDSRAKVLSYFGMPLPGLAVQVRPENVERIRALIEADDTLDPDLRNRLLGVIDDERPDAGGGAKPTRSA
jgi:transcriptional regulator with XRE-family HTH domain